MCQRAANQCSQQLQNTCTFPNCKHFVFEHLTRCKQCLHQCLQVFWHSLKIRILTLCCLCFFHICMHRIYIFFFLFSFYFLFCFALAMNISIASNNQPNQQSKRKKSSAIWSVLFLIKQTNQPTFYLFIFIFILRSQWGSPLRPMTSQSKIIIKSSAICYVLLNFFF